VVLKFTIKLVQKIWKPPCHGWLAFAPKALPQRS